MSSVGQFGPIVVKSGSQISGTFQLNKYTNINKKSKPCITDPDFSYNKCVKDFVIDSNCSIDVQQKKFNCSNNGLKKLYHLLNEVRSSSKDKIAEATGCLPKCGIHKYTFHFKEEEKLTWKRGWISAFYMASETTKYYNSIETYSYEPQVNFY